MYILQPGDHIRVYRLAYWHHGIYEGGDGVIHFTDLNGGKSRASIRRGTFDQFKATGQVQVVPYSNCDDVDVTLSRARSKIDDSAYDLFHNNCEHFARWCKTGRHESFQAKNARTAVGVVALFSLGAMALRVAGEDDDDKSRCKGETAAGARCKNLAYEGNYGFCRVHRRR